MAAAVVDQLPVPIDRVQDADSSGANTEFSSDSLLEVPTKDTEASSLDTVPDGVDIKPETQEQADEELVRKPEDEDKKSDSGGLGGLGSDIEEIDRHDYLDTFSNRGCSCAECKAARDEEKRGWVFETKRFIKYYDQLGDQHTKDDTGNEEDLRSKPSEYGKKGGPILKVIRCLDRQYKLEATRLEVQSPALVGALLHVLGQARLGIVDMEVESGKCIIKEPYMILYQNHKELKDYAAETKDESTQKHMQYLLEWMESDGDRAVQKLDEIEKGTLQTITYDLIWLLYPPGTIVYSQAEGELQAYRVLSLSEGFARQAWFKLGWTGLTLRLSSLKHGYKGKSLVVTTTSGKIMPFEDSVTLDKLKYMPERFLSEEDRHTNRSFLTERGNQYWSYLGEPRCVEHLPDAENEPDKNASVRVVIDIDGANSDKDRYDYDGDKGVDDPWVCSDPNCSTCKANREKKESIHSAKDEYPENNIVDGEKPVDDALFFCPPTIPVFSLKTREGRSAFLKDLKEPNWDVDVWDKKIVIEPGVRLIVESLVRSYVRKDVAFADLVKGKGKGLVILLHGSPGIGKTLTAECIAESEKRPLYMVTCGDLGTRADDLETKLYKTFERASRWNAVLLLDEADVFLQERDVQNLERNALVSVFLRNLEYFEGILFLTTNRPGIIDEAFTSRIHVTLRLPNLNKDQQQQIWKMFLKSQPIPDDQYRALKKWIKNQYKDSKASPNMNGRQIRNAVRTAMALAAEESHNKKDKQVILGETHLKTVIDITLKFSAYLEEVNGMKQDERAHAFGVRVISDQRR